MITGSLIRCDLFKKLYLCGVKPKTVLPNETFLFFLLYAPRYEL